MHERTIFVCVLVALFSLLLLTCLFFVSSPAYATPLPTQSVYSLSGVKPPAKKNTQTTEINITESIGNILDAINRYSTLILSGATILLVFCAYRSIKIVSRDLTLRAYNEAIESIIEVKRAFAQRPEIYRNQVNQSRELIKYIPDGMNEETFLTFASGMWHFSYVYSVIERAKELHLKKEEYEALEAEMKLWLGYVPGFYQIYEKFISLTPAHNENFKAFLRNFYSSAKFTEELKKHFIPPNRPNVTPMPSRRTKNPPRLIVFILLVLLYLLAQALRRKK